jgi:hypothetical protein
MGMIAFFAGLIMGLILGAIMMALISMCMKRLPKIGANLDLGEKDIPLPQDQYPCQPRSLIISLLSKGSFQPPEQTLY